MSRAATFLRADVDWTRLAEALGLRRASPSDRQQEAPTKLLSGLPFGPPRTTSLLSWSFLAPRQDSNLRRTDKEAGEAKLRRSQTLLNAPNLAKWGQNLVSAIDAGMIRLNNYRRLHWSVACGVFKESG